MKKRDRLKKEESSCGKESIYWKYYFLQGREYLSESRKIKNTMKSHTSLSSSRHLKNISWGKTSSLWVSLVIIDLWKLSNNFSPETLGWQTQNAFNNNNKQTKLKQNYQHLQISSLIKVLELAEWHSLFLLKERPSVMVSFQFSTSLQSNLLCSFINLTREQKPEQKDKTAQPHLTNEAENKKFQILSLMG